MHALKVLQGITHPAKPRLAWLSGPLLWVKGGETVGKGRNFYTGKGLELWVKGGSSLSLGREKAAREPLVNWFQVLLLDAKPSALKLEVADSAAAFEPCQSSLGSCCKLAHVLGARAAGGM